jgi:hypothetical protein
MLEILPESQGNILGIRASGKLTDNDYKTVLIPRLETIIREQGKARVLCHMDEDFHGWDMEALWDDAQFGVAHRHDFEKFAVAGGSRWVEWGAKLGALFMKTELRTFPSDQLQEAWDWIES